MSDDEPERAEPAPPELDAPMAEGPILDPSIPDPPILDPALKPPSPRTPWWSLRDRPKVRAFVRPVGATLLVAVIGVNAIFIERSLHPTSAPVDAPSAAPSAAVPPLASSGAEAATDGATPPPLDKPAENGGDGIDPSDPEGDESPKVKQDAPVTRHAKKAQTVGQAFSSGCSTSSVDGLSRQIVAEARCLDADAFAVVPGRPNLVVAGHVSLRLEAPARDKLLRVLDAHPHRTMTINSAFRTVAQQYLLDKWSRTKRCGIELAAHPGESNHETGLALDVKEHGTWRSALESEGFHWLGPSDRVHFDFAGPGALAHDGLDVRAFQRLWNRNHPDDAIAENGRYDSATESHLKKAPAQGFAVGPQCTRSRQADRGAAHAKTPSR